jgi:hypothetical protein
VAHADSLKLHSFNTKLNHSIANLYSGAISNHKATYQFFESLGLLLNSMTGCCNLPAAADEWSFIKGWLLLSGLLLHCFGCWVVPTGQKDLY